MNHGVGAVVREANVELTVVGICHKNAKNVKFALEVSVEGV